MRAGRLHAVLAGGCPGSGSEKARRRAEACAVSITHGMRVHGSAASAAPEAAQAWPRTDGMSGGGGGDNAGGGKVRGCILKGRAAERGSITSSEAALSVSAGRTISGRRSNTWPVWTPLAGSATPYRRRLARYFDRR